MADGTLGEKLDAHTDAKIWFNVYSTSTSSVIPGPAFIGLIRSY